jgi:hypothetical protein
LRVNDLVQTRKTRRARREEERLEHQKADAAAAAAKAVGTNPSTSARKSSVFEDTDDTPAGSIHRIESDEFRPLTSSRLSSTSSLARVTPPTPSSRHGELPGPTFTGAGLSNRDGVVAEAISGLTSPERTVTVVDAYQANSIVSVRKDGLLADTPVTSDVAARRNEHVKEALQSSYWRMTPSQLTTLFNSGTDPATAAAARAVYDAEPSDVQAPLISSPFTVSHNLLSCLFRLTA